MALEEELVFRLRNQGYSNEDVVETCNDLAKLDLSEKLLHDSLKKYNALQKYRNKNPNQRGTEKRMKEKIKRLTEEKINEVSNEYNSKILFIKKGIIDSKSLDICPNCNRDGSKLFTGYLTSRQIKAIGIDSIKLITLFEYCRKCGLIKNY